MVSMHCRWSAGPTLLHTYSARAFDYAARLVAVARLEPIVAPVERIIETVSFIAGVLSP